MLEWTGDWTDYPYGVRVESPMELFTIINRIALLDGGRTFAWRGQRDSRWKLTSSLYRRLKQAGVKPTADAIGEAERESLTKAREWGLLRELGTSATDLHLMTVFQHHGIPTRLIDVTSNPFTALWFACDPTVPEGREEGSSTLFAVDVTDAPVVQSFTLDLRVSSIFGGSALSTGLVEATAFAGSHGNPFWRLISALPDERMKAQEGYFLVSSQPDVPRLPGVASFDPVGAIPSGGALEQLKSIDREHQPTSAIPICAIVIPAHVKKLIRGPLKGTFNRRRRVLFPDVDGFRDTYFGDGGYLRAPSE